MERLDDAGVERIFAGDFASLHHFLFNIDRIAGMGLLGNVIGAQARGRDTVRLGFQMQGAGGSHGKLRLIQHIRRRAAHPAPGNPAYPHWRHCLRRWPVSPTTTAPALQPDRKDEWSSWSFRLYRWLA